MSNTIRLKEYSCSDSLDLSSEERHLITTKYKDRLGISRPIEGEGYNITSNSYVGVYNVGRYKLLVEPKVPLVNVFKMLCYAYDLIYFDTDQADYQNIDDLFEYLIKIFQQKIMKVVKRGLYRNYLEEVDDLAYIKGRIDIRDMIINKGWKGNKVKCKYDEYTTDIAENQIVKYALNQLLRLSFKDKDIKRSIVIASRYFDGVADRCIYVEDIARIEYTILNSHYKEIHSFCRMILELVGIHEREGNERFNAYYLDMNLLYEKYIGKLLEEKLSDYEVELQSRMHLDLEKEIRIKPDVVIYKDNVPLLVIDTKYKAKSDVDNPDVYQMNGYMNTLGVDGVLLYPQHEIQEKKSTLGNHVMHIKTFDLANLEESRSKLFDWIKNSSSYRAV